MDPFSVVAFVGATSKVVYSLSTALYTFIDSAKTVDKSLQALHGEVRGLYDVLETVDSTLKASVIIRTKEIAPLASGVWRSIEEVVNDSHRTATALQTAIFRSLGDEDSASNAFRRTVKQIQLNINADDIRNIRSRIQTHSSNLQLALQSATL